MLEPIPMDFESFIVGILSIFSVYLTILILDLIKNMWFKVKLLI